MAFDMRSLKFSGLSRINFFGGFFKTFTVPREEAVCADSLCACVLVLIALCDRQHCVP